jgi:antirestriction protein ArdC
MRSSERQSAAYLKGWAAHLRGEPTAVVKAAGQAQRAVDWLLGCSADRAPPAVDKAATPPSMASHTEGQS